MSLIVVVTNVSALAPVSEYTYQVLVGDGSPSSHVIAHGTVTGHTRTHGWKALVRKVLKDATSRARST